MRIPRVTCALVSSIGLVCGSAWAQVVTEFSAGITAGASLAVITQGQDGNIWFTEEGLDRIGRITLAGVVTEFGGLTAGAQPRGITRGPDGNLWFTENGGNRIGKIDPTTGSVTEFSAGITAGAKPRSITGGSDGNLWFTEEGIDKIGRITPAGVVTEFGGLTAGAFPFGIAAGSDGNLWFTENLGNRIGRIDPTSGVVTEFSAGITPGAGLTAITPGPDGNLWFSEVGANKIGRITPAGVVTEFGGLAAGATPNGITAGSDGNLWFAENNGNAIGRITPLGVVTEFTAGISPGAQPRRITSGLDGNLWFTEFAGRIGRITTGGNTQAASNVQVDLNGGASTPGGITISFAQVTGAGNTAGATSASCPPTPAGFSLGTPAVCYALTTTALFIPPVQVCINFAGVSFGAGQIALLDDQGGTWVDVTTSVDSTNHVVCGNVDSLSSFVVATFVLTGDGSLTVNRIGAGSGTVTSADAAINCGGTCGPIVYANGSKITLTAAAGSGDVFTGWSGACGGTASTCIATIIGATTVTATFAHASLDIDASAPATRYNVSTDGVLVLRWMLGFTGPALTIGALDINNAQRTSPIAIANYLGGLGLLLDIDDNGTVDALTDGVLLIRYLLGLTGDALIHGALGAGANRITGEAVGTHLQTLMP
jgi:streptogramin lyase